MIRSLDIVKEYNELLKLKKLEDQLNKKLDELDCGSVDEAFHEWEARKDLYVDLLNSLIGDIGTKGKYDRKRVYSELSQLEKVENAYEGRKKKSDRDCGDA